MIWVSTNADTFIIKLQIEIEVALITKSMSLY